LLLSGPSLKENYCGRGISFLKKNNGEEDTESTTMLRIYCTHGNNSGQMMGEGLNDIFFDTYLKF